MVDSIRNRPINHRTRIEAFAQAFLERLAGSQGSALSRTPQSPESPLETRCPPRVSIKPNTKSASADAQLFSVHGLAEQVGHSLTGKRPTGAFSQSVRLIRPNPLDWVFLFALTAALSPNTQKDRSAFRAVFLISLDFITMPASHQKTRSSTVPVRRFQPLPSCTPDRLPHGRRTPRRHRSDRTADSLPWLRPRPAAS